MSKPFIRCAAVLALVGGMSAQAAQVVQDSSFEAGTPNPFWTESSTNFGTPLCDAATCGAGPGPRTGDWWAWFGGSGIVETSLVSQSMTFSAGTAELRFWFEASLVANSTDFIAAKIDGSTVWSFVGEAPFTGYKEVVVNLNAFADGANHVLSFNSTTSGSPDVTNFFVDDVTVMTNAVPEPSALGLGAIALSGLLALRRVRRS